MNRRRFLLLSGLSTAGLLLGSAALRVRTAWWTQPSSDEFHILSSREADIARAIIDAMFPGDHLGMPNGNDVDVIRTLDNYLHAIPPSKANLLRLLLHAIDDVARPAGARFRPFRRRTRQERIDLLARWDQSRLSARQEAFQALKIILCMGYCESPRVIRAARFDYTCGGWQ